MSQQRLPSGKIDRHNQAIKKYQEYENSKTNQAKLNDMIKGQNTLPLIPKPGEFLTVASDRPANQQLYYDIPMRDLVDGNKTFTDLKLSSVERMQIKNAKKPPIKDPYDEGVLRREDLVEKQTVLDEFGIETSVQPQFTQSIRQIVKRQYKDMLAPTNQTIKAAIEEHLPPIRMSQSSQAIRPISANYLLKALNVNEEHIENSKGIQQSLWKAKRFQMQSAKPRNLYMPHIDEDIKHLTGYQTIRLNAADFKLGFEQEYIKEKQQKLLDKHFKHSAVDPRLYSPFIREDRLASAKIQRRQDLNGELELTKYRTKMFLSEPHELKQVFLPLDFYILDDEYGVDLIRKYTRNNVCLGSSKWFDTNGEYTWDDCQIIGYIHETDKFEIRFIKQNKLKQVTRVNLRFKEEDLEAFEKQLQIADHYRKQSEIFIKYNYMIDKMDDISSQLTDAQLMRIQIFALGYYFKMGTLRDPLQFNRLDASTRYNFKRYLIPKLLNNNNQQPKDICKQRGIRYDSMMDLLKEVKQQYIRGNHECQFRRMLPFSEEKQAIFLGHLPNEMFDAVPQLKLVTYPTERGIGMSKFIELFSTMKKILHQAQSHKQQTLLEANITLLRLEEQHLFVKQFQGPIPLEEMDRLQKWKIGDAIRDVKTRMYDVHFEIMEMVEQEVKILKHQEEEKLRLIVLEADRRLFQEQGLMSENLTLLLQFQKLINIKFERSSLELWNRSIADYLQFIDIQVDTTLEPLEQIFNYAKDREYTQIGNEMLINIEVVLENQQIKLEPNPEIIRESLQQYVWMAIKELTSIPCMRTREIESARDDQLMHVFEALDDKCIVDNKAEVRLRLDTHVKLLDVYFNKLKEFEQILDYSVDRRIKKGAFDEYSKELDRLIILKGDFKKYMFKKQLRIGVFYVNLEAYHNKLLDKLRLASDSLYENLIAKIGKENQKIESDIQKMIEQLNYDPKNLEELNNLRFYAKDQLETELNQISKKINKVMDKLTLMEKMSYKITYENFSKTWSIYGMPLKLMRKQEKCLRRLQNGEKKFQDDLLNQQGELSGEINYLNKELDTLIMEEDINQINQIASKFADLGDRIERAQEQADIVNRRELILKWKPSEYGEIEKIKKVFTPYYRVWGLGRDYLFKIPQAKTGALNNVDRDQLTTDVQEAWTELFKLEKSTFKIIQHMYVVTLHIRKMYEDFKPYLPLINDLRNPALKKQHWASLAVILKLDEDPNFSLQTILDRGAMDCREEIREISETASKQSQFERSINKMKGEWKNIKFDLLEFRDTETYVLKSVEPILDKLDEDITKIMSIASSPFVAFLLNEVNGWKSQLFRAQEIIELWCKSQKSWQYLQPIFFSEDIIREMPKEGNKYSIVDKLWRSVMSQTLQQPLVMEACFQSRMKENFIFMIEQLDQVIKGLNEFLNKKRSSFPRFYFLSNEELLQILAQAREPQAVQKHLQKCFEGIYELTFLEDLRITEMSSQSMETIKLTNEINPMSKDGTVRGVEEWLYEVQQSMKLTMKSKVQEAITTVTTKSLELSIGILPSQLNVLAHEIIFTNLVTESIIQQQKTIDSLKKCLATSQDTLLKTVKLLHHDLKDANQIQTLGVLIVLQVKQKDIVAELEDKRISKIDDFDWMAQMRYYWDKEVSVKMLHTSRLYGYEYLGNQSRLVITPLTDRCYRTLMAALHMNLGGAPEGPAGTGKTETTKDLAKAMAKHCVVFNCSDSLDYLAMGKFFKGLVSCGSWACFDEFNRIELEVLSVIAQQILVIQTAIVKESASKVPMKTFTFEGQSLVLDSSCAIFITMNPGYQGRSELPDNLKALFRSVAMMIPNYAMITEISLYSYGFTAARELSIKITTSLKLASEQLSTQSHYDFGMRAVKSIILAAGKLKRESNCEDEINVLRAIEDCNLPKFTSKDVPLFQAIISDLFPGVQPEDREYGTLTDKIKETIDKDHLTYNDRFYTKIIQLHETINVRHGLMVVGATLSGKSTIINTLAKSSAVPIYIHQLNPKSITPKLLYGDVDSATNEWQDGITAVIFRECIEKSGTNWVLFDGPVDALWIENMNTVLDDNKKLCLTNGETIKLTDTMRIVFEVEDLLEASPATVSRCGMVYLESEESMWKSLISVWKAELTNNFQHECYLELFDQLYMQLEYVFIAIRQCHLVHITSYELMAMSCLKLYQAFLLKNKTKSQLIVDLEIENDKEQARIRALQLEGKSDQIVKRPKIIQDRDKTELVALFYLSIVWSVGALLEADKREYFSNYIKGELEKAMETFKCTKDLVPPKELSAFEINFDFEKKNWNLWNGKHEFRIAKNTLFHEIYVPTADSSSTHGLLKQMLFHNQPVLLYGRTGTGKTMIIKKVLLDELDQSKFIPTTTAFSATTNCLQVLEILESKLEKQKRRKGIYGPEVGKTNIIFIDDMNMPSKEQFGAQPPLELVRQWFIQQGWYDKKTLEFKQIADIQFCGAMGLGRPNIPQRLVRHFNMIHIPDSHDDVLGQILNKIFEYGFEEYIDKVKFVSKNLPKLCLIVYNQVTDTFLPLPSKSHYLFNFRDLMKVAQGVLMVPNSKYDATGDTRGKLLKLWAHENMRVYQDRLVSETDRQQLTQILSDIIEEEYNIQLKDVIGDSQLYGNWVEPHSIAKQYCELPDSNKIQSLLNEYILEFNDFYPKLKLNIVLFEDAIQFICKINRIISQPFGNALLIGLGGTGCRTLSRLSAFMQDYKIGELDVDREFSIQEWYDFWRDLMKSVGIKNEQSIFLFPDAQIINEVLLEDINNILNIGEITNLYPADDKENMIGDFRDILTKECRDRDQPRINYSQLQVWEQFVKRCKSNLHLVIYLSPVGDKLKSRIRNFPSLVSCTSILWVEAWSAAALQQVAYHLLPDEQVGKACVGLHTVVQQVTEQYHRKTGYHYYVTPLSYIQLLNNFQLTYETYSTAIQKQRDKYANGVKMLDDCGVIVEKLKVDLEELQPVLIQKTAETDLIMKKVEQETAIAEEQKKLVKVDEIETQLKADHAKSISDQCQERLGEAEPQLEEALQALKTLKLSDFVEMKSFKNPPKLIRVTMDSVAIMMERKPKKAADGSDDYWDESVKLLSDPNKFIKSLEKYNRNNIPEKVIQKMTQFLNINKQFQPAVISKANKAAEGLCKWVLAIYKYYFVFKEITPLREANEKANQIFKQASDELAAKQEQLRLVEEMCQDLRDQFENENFSKQTLKAQITECEVKMKRALELTNGLSGEQSRWRLEVIRLQKNLESLLGDMVLSVGYLSYLGAFTYPYRKAILSQWQEIIQQNQVPTSANYQLIDCLSNQLEIQDWILCGLPLDDFSKENAIIMNASNNYPLIIDPQGQATKFIQRKEKKINEKAFKVCKPDKYLANTLESCIRDGHVLMIINVGQTLDGLLEPVLSKQYQMSNGRPLISIAGNQVIVNPAFKLYLITSLPNPHYTPSILTKVTLINFTITPEALKDQMTSMLVREEEPQLEEEKLRIMNDNSMYKVRMKSEMLEDEKLTVSLAESKVTSEEITQRLKEARTTEERINNNRQNYDQISTFASNTYFTILKLSHLDDMYLFSLDFYQRVFRKSIRLAERPSIKNIKQRILMITESLKKVVFQEISRSIFVKHKNLFSFMLLLTQYSSQGTLNMQEMQYLLTGLPTKQLEHQINNPNEQIFSATQWEMLQNIQTLDSFSGIDLTDQSTILYLNDPTIEIPTQLELFSQFQRLLLIRAARPNLFGHYMRELVASDLGAYFTQNLMISIDDSYNDSSVTTPLVFILQAGDDPQDEVKKFAMERAKILTFVSLGKGQGDNAKQMILESLAIGQWVILQNCHLAISWLPELDQLLQLVASELLKKEKDREIKINQEFRLWMTTMSTPSFPQQLIMEAVKMTKDPPKGVKDNIQQIYNNQNSSKNEKKFYDTCGEKSAEFKQFYLSLCYFHAVVRERRRYGPVGWNIHYDFNDSDFKISIRQLKQMLMDYQEIPYNALIYLTGECYYGGKVTDDWDRRCLRVLLGTFYNMHIYYDNYKFSSVPEYCIPDNNTLNNIEDAIQFIKELPDTNTPELFGLHPNAAITMANLETSHLLSCLLDVGLVEQSSSVNVDKNKLLLDRAELLLTQIPKLIDQAVVSEKYQINYYESMNTVLIQEVTRYNTLLSTIHKSINDLIKAAQGLIVMSTSLEKMGDSLLNNMIPQLWKQKSYPSLKSLSNYLTDLEQRISVFQSWIDQGTPKQFWVSGFYFTQSFFTGVLQNHARKHKIPIDQLKFNFQVTQDPVEDGITIFGLYIESAIWNSDKAHLDESKAGEIYQQMPHIQMIPTKEQNNQDKDYLCPVYKTLDRKGTLSTTGHSTNFIIAIPLQTQINAEHWVKRGTAMICQLNE